MFRILVINIGSTSTKVGMFADGRCLFKKTQNHTPSEMAALRTFDQWLGFHRKTVDAIMEWGKDRLASPDLIVSRGGLTRPLETGAYRIDRDMISDLRSGDYGWHPSNVGPVIAGEMAARTGAEAIIYDSPVSDEMISVARFSGLNDIERRAAFHVLSQKSAARRAADSLWAPYRDASFVVAHLGGGITICAHKKGRIIDGTHGINEGPFTPQRTGALPLGDVIDLCFSGEFSPDELQRRFFKTGGIVSYLGTHDVEKLEKAASGRDTRIRFVLRAMGYQITKEIGSMAAVLSGRVAAVVITGGLARSATVVDEIRRRTDFIAPLLVFPGEAELEALAAGGESVLKKREPVKTF